MPDNNTYSVVGGQLDEDFRDIREQLEALGKLVSDIENDTNIDEQRVNELIDDRLAAIRSSVDGLAVSLSDVQTHLGELEGEIETLRDVTPNEPDLSDERAAIDRELAALRLISRPTHRSKILTGLPSGDFHSPGDWGQIITVHEDVNWLSAMIDPQSEGVTKLVVYRMDYTAPVTDTEGNYVSGGTYDLGDVHATLDLHHQEAGPQEINPEIHLPEGQYFITRDPETVVPMRRIEQGVDWDAYNAGHDVPLTVECSWRAHASYRPGTDAYEKYRSNGWHLNNYYFGDQKFGFDRRLDENGG